MKKLVIDIQEEVIEHAKNKSEDSRDEYVAMRAIEHGTPIESILGEWEEIYFDNMPRFWDCSECKKRNTWQSDFCPSCGVPMTEKALEILSKRGMNRNE